jgi:hypothetical protein
MKPAAIRYVLQLALFCICTSCGDESRSDTQQNDSAIQSSDPASNEAENSNKKTPPSTPHSVNNSTEIIAKSVSSSRSKGDTITALSEMHKLMKQWSPIGMSRDVIIESLGKPTSSNDQAMIYRFDHGEGGWQWVFEIENGLVSKVHKVGLE